MHTLSPLHDAIIAIECDNLKCVSALKKAGCEVGRTGPVRRDNHITHAAERAAPPYPLPQPPIDR